MRRLTIGWLLTVLLALASPLQAQERLGAGRIEIGAFPAGALVFRDTSSTPAPQAGRYALGATLGYRINGWIGVEGELGNALGASRQMRGGEGADEQPLPALYAYAANAIVTPTGTNGVVVPYLAASVGGFTFRASEETAPGSAGRTTFLTTSVGGGTKWYARRHWGLRADYRLVIVDNIPSRPALFGREAVRYGHRVYGGLLVTY